MAVHLTDMEELIAQIVRSDSRDYMSEALGCYQAGAFRACVVLSYIALFDDLRAKLKPLAGVNSTAKMLHEEIEKRAMNQEIYESYLADQLAATKVIDSGQKTALEIIIKLRNKAAHPSGIHATAEEARYVFKEIVEKFLRLPALETTIAADSILSMLDQGNYFPTNKLQDIATIVAADIIGVHEQALPYLIAKLFKNRSDAAGAPRTHVRFFLWGLASLKKDSIRSRLKSQLVELVKSTGEAGLALGLLHVDPALAEGMEKADKDRISSLIQQSVTGDMTRLGNPLGVMAALVAEFGQDKIWSEYKSALDSLLDKYLLDEGMVRIVSKPGVIQEEYLKLFEARASSSQFETANRAASALLNLDGVLAAVISSEQCFRLLAATAQAAGYGAFTAKGVVNGDFVSLGSLRASAAGLITSDPAKAQKILDEFGVSAPLQQIAGQLVSSQGTAPSLPLYPGTQQIDLI
jgi:hypothetical protein